MRKTFDQNIAREDARALFHREVAVLRCFADLKANCVPRLVDLDESALWHETERLEGARAFDVWLMSAPSNGLEAVISQLIAIDKLLYLNRIDYRVNSLQHVLVNKDFETFITGFEYTRLGHRFSDVLFSNLFQHFHLSRKESDVPGVFMSSLIARRDEVHNYFPRKLRKLFIQRFGLGSFQK